MLQVTLDIRERSMPDMDFIGVINGLLFQPLIPIQDILTLSGGLKVNTTMALQNPTRLSQNSYLAEGFSCSSSDLYIPLSSATQQQLTKRQIESVLSD